MTDKVLMKLPYFYQLFLGNNWQWNIANVIRVGVCQIFWARSKINLCGEVLLCQCEG